MYIYKHWKKVVHSLSLHYIACSAIHLLHPLTDEVLGCPQVFYHKDLAVYTAVDKFIVMDILQPRFKASLGNDLCNFLAYYNVDIIYIIYIHVYNYVIVNFHTSSIIESKQSNIGQF